MWNLRVVRLTEGNEREQRRAMRRDSRPSRWHVVATWRLRQDHDTRPAAALEASENSRAGEPVSHEEERDSTISVHKASREVMLKSTIAQHCRKNRIHVKQNLVNLGSISGIGGEE